MTKQIVLSERIDCEHLLGKFLEHDAYNFIVNELAERFSPVYTMLYHWPVSYVIEVVVPELPLLNVNTVEDVSIPQPVPAPLIPMHIIDWIVLLVK